MSFFTAKRLPFLAIVAAIPFCQLLSLCSSPHPAAALILPVTKTLPRKKEDRKKQKLPQNATPSMQAPAFMKREKGREGERGRIENDSIVGGGGELAAAAAAADRYTCGDKRVGQCITALLSPAAAAAAAAAAARTAKKMGRESPPETDRPTGGAQKRGEEGSLPPIPRMVTTNDRDVGGGGADF